MGDHCWIVARMPAEQKQLIHASQIAVHKTLFALDSPLSFCSITDQERRGEWGCACAQNLNTCCFIPYGNIISVCILKIVMADWNCSNHFGISCIHTHTHTHTHTRLKIVLIQWQNLRSLHCLWYQAFSYEVVYELDWSCDMKWTVS